MAKRAGWYPDPWGGSGYRWWNGSQWTELNQPHQGPPPSPGQPGMVVSGPLSDAVSPRPWWQSWWFIVLVTFFCCFPLGIVLIWTRRSTPVGAKIVVTAAVVLAEVMLALILESLQPGLYRIS